MQSFLDLCEEYFGHFVGIIGVFVAGLTGMALYKGKLTWGDVVGGAVSFTALVISWEAWKVTRKSTVAAESAARHAIVPYIKEGVVSVSGAISSLKERGTPQPSPSALLARIEEDRQGLRLLLKEDVLSERQTC